MEAITNAIYDLAEKHLGEYRFKNGQLVTKRCPFCGGGNNNDYETFAIGLNNGLWNCLRGSCKKKKGNFKELCDFFGERYDLEDIPRYINLQGKKKKTYVKPNPDDLKELSDEAITYFGSRRISEDTLKAFKIACDNKGNIVFPFYRDGVLTYVKYRKPKKRAPDDKSPKEWAMADTEPILFGMDNVSYNMPVAITEGMIDALSLYEAGFHNVLSVPSGCNNMDWLNTCYDWLDQFNQIILFGDSDEPGMEMVSALAKRLGTDRCMIPQEYPELKYNGKDYNCRCKDANAILCCYGAQYLLDMINACEPAPIKGVVDVSTIQYIDPTKVPRILTKIPALDRQIGGFKQGGVSVISGRSGEGKSTITGQLMLSAVEQGYNVCAYSGELNDSQFLEWICHQAVEAKYVGYRIDEKSGKTFTYISDEIIQRVKDYLQGHMFLYKNEELDEESETDAMLRVFEACARRNGCSLFVADNLMCLTISPDEENRAQQKVAAKLKAFAKKYNVHVILIAHPRKRNPGTKFTNDDISGASAIGNLADTIMSIEKPNIQVK